MDTLRDLRKASGKSVAEVARVLHVCERAVARYEDGSRRISVEQIIPLARLYGVTAEEIISAQAISVAVRKS